MENVDIDKLFDINYKYTSAYYRTINMNPLDVK